MTAPRVEIADRFPITLTINGQERSEIASTRTLLVHFIRDQLGLTGTHIGCDTGNCGACTIVLDGKAVKSCMMLAVQAHEAEILTVEGLAPSDKELHPIQQAFSENHALQCGYCTPGMLLAAKALLERSPEPTDDEIRTGIKGNLCRCTGYQNIVAAIRTAAQTLSHRP